MWVSLKTCVNVYHIFIWIFTYLKKSCRFYATIITPIAVISLSLGRSNTRSSMRRTKGRWSALSRSVVTLRWPTLLWPPNYRVTATTRGTMRTPRPNSGDVCNRDESFLTLVSKLVWFKASLMSKQTRVWRKCVKLPFAIDLIDFHDTLPSKPEWKKKRTLFWKNIIIPFYFEFLKCRVGLYINKDLS